MHKIACLTFLFVWLPLNLIGQSPRTPKQPAPTFLARDFDTSMDQIPPGFLGHNPVKILESAKALSARMQKSEYETESQWLERRNTILRSPVLGGMTIGGTFALVISNLTAPGVLWSKYDADRRRLNVWVEARSLDYSQADNWRSVRVIETARSSSYLGQNAFGV